MMLRSGKNYSRPHALADWTCNQNLYTNKSNLYASYREFSFTIIVYILLHSLLEGEYKLLIQGSFIDNIANYKHLFHK